MPRFVNRHSDRLIQLVVELGLITENLPSWDSAWSSHWQALQACGVFDTKDFNRVVRLMKSGKLLASDIQRVMDENGNHNGAMTELYRECERIE